jgi:hypothetical protein
MRFDIMTDVPTGLNFVEAAPAPTHFNGILYGPAKSGKSTAALTLPYPILYVNVEGPNALGFARKHTESRGRIHEVRIAKDEDPRATLREVIRHVRSGDKPQPASVVVDTLGKVREQLIAHMVEAGSKNTLQQFGEVAKVIKEFVGLLRDEPVHLWLICHEDIKDGDGDGRIVQPLIGGATTAYVMGEVDVIAYTGAVTTSDGTKYLGQLVEGRGRRAGDRSGALGAARELDLAEWWGVYRDALTPSDLPWGDDDASVEEFVQGLKDDLDGEEVPGA